MSENSISISIDKEQIAKMEAISNDFLSGAFAIGRRSGFFSDDEKTFELFKFLFQRNLFNGDYHKYIDKIIGNVDNASFEELSIYLTGIARAERICDSFSIAYTDGTLDALIRRWLKLARERYK